MVNFLYFFYLLGGEQELVLVGDVFLGIKLSMLHILKMMEFDNYVVTL